MRIRLQIWDTAGQVTNATRRTVPCARARACVCVCVCCSSWVKERYKSIGASYYRAAMGIFYVFDVTEGKSFDSIQNWLRDSNTDPETSATSAALPVVKVPIRSL